MRIGKEEDPGWDFSGLIGDTIAPKLKNEYKIKSTWEESLLKAFLLVGKWKVQKIQKESIANYSGKKIICKYKMGKYLKCLT